MQAVLLPFVNARQRRRNRAAPLYHLLLEREQLRTSDLDGSLTHVAGQGTVKVREAWTDVSDVGVGRRRDLTEIDTFRQI